MIRLRKRGCATPRRSESREEPSREVLECVSCPPEPTLQEFVAVQYALLQLDLIRDGAI